MEEDRAAARAAGGPCGIRTFLVFTDLPVHVEFRVAPMPLLSVGTVLDFDLVLRSPSDPRRFREVSGEYRVSASRLRVSSRLPGLSQYLELTPVPK